MGGISVYYLAAVEYLADGQWHDLEKTVRRVMDAVPPGKAIQKAERARIHQHKKMARLRGEPDAPVPPRRSQYDTERLIQVGARTIARSTLNNKGRFMINDECTKIRLLNKTELAARRKEGDQKRAHNGWDKRLRAKGIDPAKHVTIAEQTRIRKEIMSKWTPEEWKQYHADNNRKAWETRRARAKEARERLQSVRGHQGPKLGPQSD